MCVLETIWETIKWNHVKRKNKCIVKVMVRWKIHKRSKKTC